MVDADVDAVPRAGFALVLPLMCVAAAVFAAVEFVAAVVAAALSTQTAATTPGVDASPRAAAQAVVASNRYCPVAREPHFESRSDATAS